MGIEHLSFQGVLGIAFAPLAWLMGVPGDEATKVGALLGVKTVLNEFIAYQDLAVLVEGRRDLAPRGGARVVCAVRLRELRVARDHARRTRRDGAVAARRDREAGPALDPRRHARDADGRLLGGPLPVSRARAAALAWLLIAPSRRASPRAHRRASPQARRDSRTHLQHPRPAELDRRRRPARANPADPEAHHRLRHRAAAGGLRVPRRRAGERRASARLPRQRGLGALLVGRRTRRSSRTFRSRRRRSPRPTASATATSARPTTVSPTRDS